MMANQGGKLLTGMDQLGCRFVETRIGRWWKWGLLANSRNIVYDIGVLAGTDSSFWAHRFFLFLFSRFPCYTTISLSPSMFSLCVSN